MRLSSASYLDTSLPYLPAPHSALGREGRRYAMRCGLRFACACARACGCAGVRVCGWTRAGEEGNSKPPTTATVSTCALGGGRGGPAGGARRTLDLGHVLGLLLVAALIAAERRVLARRAEQRLRRPPTAARGRGRARAPTRIAICDFRHLAHAARHGPHFPEAATSVWSRQRRNRNTCLEVDGVARDGGLLAALNLDDLDREDQHVAALDCGRHVAAPT